MKAFITGATGFVGSHVARALAAQGADLRLLVRSTSRLDNIADLRSDTATGDLRDPESLTALSHHDYMERGGAESVEMILWLAMRGALGPTPRRVHRNYHAPLITGYGLLALEP